ncbi:hypothetical protein [Escherichia coli]|uniref:hypothetical protein n=1 Tax=Escherichia coli TaxID=562 RepID=UPI000DDA0FAC|nr:hypothetical protein [Escherichia coli]
MRKLVILSLSSAALFIPLLSSAMTIHGDIHPERYTFFLTQEGSNQLKQANDRITTTTGEALTMTVGYTYGNASSKEPGWRTISVNQGDIITDIRKQGQWVPNGYK